MKQDTIFNDIREKSLNQWLDEMEQHEDIAVRGGVRLTRDYMEYLKDEIRNLQEQCKLREEYLKKMKEKIYDNKRRSN